MYSLKDPSFEKIITLHTGAIEKSMASEMGMKNLFMVLNECRTMQRERQRESPKLNVYPNKHNDEMMDFEEGVSKNAVF